MIKHTPGYVFKEIQVQKYFILEELKKIKDSILVHYEMPRAEEEFTHRNGRAARVDSKGTAYILKKENEEISSSEIEKKLFDIKLMIKGNFKASIDRFKNEMDSLSVLTKFEKAQKIKEKLEILYNYQVKSTIVNPNISEVDVFSIYSDDSFAYVNFMQISFGAIISSYTIEIKKSLNESDNEILRISLIELRQRFKSNSIEVILPFDLNLGSKIKCIIPKVGDKKKLLELSIRNAKYYRMERFKQIRITDPNRHENRIMSQMKKDLRLHEEPRHIECFDNSNIQGTHPVAACVVFKNGKASKKDYRHYNIKTVGPDDFASMEEVVFRRYFKKRKNIFTTINNCRRRKRPTIISNKKS